MKGLVDGDGKQLRHAEKEWRGVCACGCVYAADKEGVSYSACHPLTARRGAAPATEGR